MSSALSTPSRALSVFGKNRVPKTNAEAAEYRRNSYHSATVPAIEAATTLRRPLFDGRDDSVIGEAIEVRSGGFIAFLQEERGWTHDCGRSHKAGEVSKAPTTPGAQPVVQLLPEQNSRSSKPDGTESWRIYGRAAC